ncbi:MAG TPA: DUF58 domain-containing protein [Longimicrobiales bacterium]|nr:DUF58 domain-containing protein [Longimicrobiales bacterium]
MPSHSRARTTIRGGARFLDPAVLARIDNLELLARTLVDGFLSGLHRSPYLGFSLDFAEHRPYMPGDDIRRIDWSLFARTDRHYIKLFEAETNANFVVLLDVSRSMSYSSHAVTKLDYARYLAAALLFFSNRQRDRVGLVTFDHDIVDFVPPSMKHMDTVLHVLDRTEAGRAGSLAEPLLTMTERLARKGILVLISDFYEEPDQVMSAVLPLRARGHDVIVFHAMDPAELGFPFEDASAFEDLETGEQIPVIPERLRDDYTRLVQAHVAELRSRFAANRVDYELLDTSRPLDLALFSYLSARERLSRVR